MATNQLPIVAGSNQPITVQLFPVDTDDTGISGIDITGATNFIAKAKLVVGTTIITFATATIVNGPLGHVLLTYLTTDFTILGTYNIQIEFQDSGGKKHIYPSEGNTLVLIVKARIT